MRIDITVPEDYTRKEQDRVEKYQDLKREIVRMWRIRKPEGGSK